MKGAPQTGTGNDLDHMEETVLLLKKRTPGQIPYAFPFCCYFFAVGGKKISVQVIIVAETQEFWFITFFQQQMLYVKLHFTPYLFYFNIFSHMFYLLIYILFHPPVAEPIEPRFRPASHTLQREGNF